MMSDKNKTREKRTDDRSATEIAGPRGEGITLTLAPPRYIPHAIVGASLAVWHDDQEGQYVALCPACSRLITYSELHALYLEMVWGERQCCPGCRAKAVFINNPHLIRPALDYWYRTNTFPQSPSWVEAILPHECTMWATEIWAGLEAATAPLMSVSPAPREPASGAETYARSA
jgi:hypothetical protein